ncbi:MAG: SIS domain-containing protein [Synergistaceae bacterium]
MKKEIKTSIGLIHEERVRKAKEIIESFQTAISSLSFNENFSRAIDIIHKCDGKIVTTGMGKGGLAMRKFSSTLCSLGISSCYLHPGEASHGDLGIIEERDILFVASTSGKTREVIEVIDLSRRVNKNPIIGLTSHPDSIIRQKADIVLDMGEIKEAGTMNLAPTTSIIVMQAFTDVLALILASEKGVSNEDFGKYHHSGYLGSVARKDEIIH